MPKQKRNVIVIGDGSPLPLTSEGLKLLQEKRARLARALPELIAEAQRTAAYGDRSDNAEYKQAKGALRSANIRLMTVEEQLSRAVLISPNKNVSGTVQLGSTVVVQSKEGGKSTFQILGSHETSPAEGRISNQSPLGAALMHKKAGETVAVKTPKGIQEYRIVEIK